MSEQNIYQAPQSTVLDDVASEGQLASRWARLGAAILDALILMVVVVPIALMLGMFEAIMQAAETGGTMSFQYTVTMAFVGLAAFLGLNGYLLAKNGQTLGKKLVNIRIVDMQGERVHFGKLIGLRYLPVWVLNYVPVGNLLVLVNYLFIFRSDKRCVHDLIAGTQVVNCR